MYHNTGKWINFVKRTNLGNLKLNIFSFLDLDPKLDLFFRTTLTNPQNQNKTDD